MEQALESSRERKVCPRCGTRLAEGATRCGVCGTELSNTDGFAAVGGRRGADVTLSIPLALALLLVFALLSAGATYAAVRYTGLGAEQPTATISPTPSVTPTITPSPQPSPTQTPLPSPTPLTHVVSENETCLQLAIFYAVSVQSIVQLNNLPASCPLSVNQRLLIPNPTATPSPEPSATLPPEEATRLACETLTYTVEANDTLGGIAQNYNVSMQAIMEYTGMSSDTVFSGQILIIPLCARNPTPGPTPTATAPPPYPAPNLLLPQDGAAFTLSDDTVSLQWASVGQLRENEYYHVTVLDVTEGSGVVRLDEYVQDTKFIVPSSFRPQGTTPHVLRWWVTTVRQIGVNGAGEVIYVSSGATSEPRVFTWSGSAAPNPAP